MPEYQSGRALAAPTTREPDELRRRLARALADMVPGAATLRVSRDQPGETWPSPFARAYDEHGNALALTRVKRMTAARWVLRAYPGADWAEVHDFDLRTATLTPAVRGEHAAGRVS